MTSKHGGEVRGAQLCKTGKAGAASFVLRYAGSKVGQPPGTFAIGQAMKVAMSGGSVASVGWAALLGSAFKGSWFFGKAVVLSDYYGIDSSFHLLTQTVAGCPGSLIPDFSVGFNADEE